MKSTYAAYFCCGNIKSNTVLVTRQLAVRADPITKAHIRDDDDDLLEKT